MRHHERIKRSYVLSSSTGKRKLSSISIYNKFGIKKSEHIMNKDGTNIGCVKKYLNLGLFKFGFYDKYFSSLFSFEISFGDKVFFYKDTYCTITNFYNIKGRKVREITKDNVQLMDISYKFNNKNELEEIIQKTRYFEKPEMNNNIIESVEELSNIDKYYKGYKYYRLSSEDRKIVYQDINNQLVIDTLIDYKNKISITNSFDNKGNIITTEIRRLGSSENVHIIQYEYIY